MEISASKESGSALVYILIAIALLAALTVTFMEPSNQQASSQNAYKLTSEIKAQADFVTSAVQECVLSWRGGDITIDTTASGTDPGASKIYPINPDSTHFTTATLGRAGDRKVSHLRCPGNPGDDKNHSPLFSGNASRFMPPPPDLFTDWEWYNGTDGVFFWTGTSKTDPYIQTALQKAVAMYADCEADIVDATGGAVKLDSVASGETVECPSGSTCFRVRMTRLPSAIPACP